MTDEEYMRHALALAKKGAGYVAPNPMVGAVIVKDGRVIGEGYHERYGELHAERNALRNCSESPKEATMYVTLEPCCHYGKTPPCTEAIIEQGIKRVVVGAMDCNPLVAGKGVKILQEHGIEVVTGVLTGECEKQNRSFFHYMRTGRPLVTMKYAMTMDGKIATRTGASQWITGEKARHRVHEDRNEMMAIMVGVGTILTDDPMLTCRIDGGNNPIRIICDTNLSTPLDAQVVRTAESIPTIIATSCTKIERQSPYLDMHCQIIEVDCVDGHLDLNALMERLGKQKIQSILLEGGGTLNWSALQSGIVNRIQAYIAPKLFGGMEAQSPVQGLGVETPDQAYTISNQSVSMIGEDILIEGEVVKCLQES